MNKQLTLKILRFNPETDIKPSWQEFADLPYDNSTSVLDMLVYIKEHLAPDLSYRSSCRMAICGSCGVMINDVPKLLCKTFIRDYANKIVEIRPLAHFPIERDLVVDMTHFMQSIETIKPYIISKQQDDNELSKKIPALMMKYQQFSQCINCGLCYAACPQFGLNPEFIGPAAITLAMRYILDSSDEGKNERMPILNQEDGVWRCTFVGYCSTVCPKQVDPASAIQLGKIESAKDYLIAKFKLNKD